MMTSVGLDGSRTEMVLWDPDDPVVMELPRGYQGPSSDPVCVTILETTLAFPLRLYRWAAKGENIRGRFYQAAVARRLTVPCHPSRTNAKLMEGVPLQQHAHLQIMVE